MHLSPTSARFEHAAAPVIYTASFAFRVHVPPAFSPHRPPQPCKSRSPQQHPTTPRATRIAHCRTNPPPNQPLRTWAHPGRFSLSPIPRPPTPIGSLRCPRAHTQTSSPGSRNPTCRQFQPSSAFLPVAPAPNSFPAIGCSPRKTASPPQHLPAPTAGLPEAQNASNLPGSVFSPLGRGTAIFPLALPATWPAQTQQPLARARKSGSKGPYPGASLRREKGSRGWGRFNTSNGQPTH